MPYDPRPESQGGNRGIDERFSRVPDGDKNQYRVVGVDTFDGGDWVYGDFTDLEEAVTFANSKGGAMLRVYVYDIDGVCVHSAGSF